jgi:hypothetical protein
MKVNTTQICFITFDGTGGMNGDGGDAVLMQQHNTVCSMLANGRDRTRCLSTMRLSFDQLIAAFKMLMVLDTEIMIGCISVGVSICLVLEYCSNSNLSHYLREKQNEIDKLC